jgi:hypothetical protein
MTPFVKCFHCDIEKPETDFSLEHIFPDALGGDYCSDLFFTNRLCRTCNSNTGLFVDGPFIRNFFVSNDEANSALNFARLDAPCLLPMRFHCTLEQLFADQDKVLDIWSGPLGGYAYHLRPQSKPEDDYVVGGHPGHRKKKAGVVFISATGCSSFWARNLLISCAEHFEHARRVALNIQFEENSLYRHYVTATLPEDAAAIERLTNIKDYGDEGGMIHHHVGFEQRFMAKLALGLGMKRLGDDFLNSESARKLKICVRNSAMETRLQSGILFTEFFHRAEDTDVFSIFSMDGVHTIVLQLMDGRIWMHLMVYGRRPLSISMTDSTDTWSHKLPQTETYFICPPAGLFAGPILLPDLINHRWGRIVIPELKAIEEKRLSDVQRQSLHDL